MKINKKKMKLLKRINQSNHTKLLFTFLLGLGLFIGCEKEPLMTDDRTMTFEYTLHNGQTVPSAPYIGIHQNDINAEMTVSVAESGNAMVSVTLNNTMDGEIYNVHAHDAADPSTTPNGTPYNETPNSNIFVQMFEGNGGSVTMSQETNMTFDQIMNEYAGFFVVHDPLQPINTADITTYLMVGSFARMQDNPSLKSTMVNYDFNNGQLVSDFAYNGTHSSNLSAMIRVDELVNNTSRITIYLMNTMDDETYATHAHDMADPATTPNGTPYNESPNPGVYAGGIIGNGGTAGRAQTSTMSYDDIVNSYDGFFVVHDPLQPINTADPTTYVILGVFARS